MPIKPNEAEPSCDAASADSRVAIIVAKEAGACYGVERALSMVREAASASSEVHTLGPLIHNPRVVAQLSKSGVNAVETLDGLKPGSTLVIRTHGVSPEVVDDAVSRGLDVLDATCPHVKKVHDSVHLLREQGYQIFIVGEPGHPEVEAILGHAGSEAVVVDRPEALDDVKIRPRVGVVAQTTQTRELLDAVVSRLLNSAIEVRVFPTICSATRRRQQAAADLARQSDMIIVVGGRNSGNTTRLAQICREHCPNTHHIEGEEELDPSWFVGAHTVGITAGASTPASQIEAVRKAVARMVEEE